MKKIEELIWKIDLVKQAVIDIDEYVDIIDETIDLLTEINNKK